MDQKPLRGGPITEFEIQALLFCKLRERGYRVRGEMMFQNGRVDIAVFDSERWELKRIIEIKTKLSGISRKQLEMYESLGVPVDVIVGLPAALEYLRIFDLNMDVFHPPKMPQRQQLRVPQGPPVPKVVG